MMESLRKIMYFGLGAAALSADKMRQLIDDLVSRGEVTQEEGRRLYEDVSARAEEQSRNLNERIRTQIRDMLKDIGVADRAEITMLESRIDVIERKIDEILANMPVKESTQG